VALFVDVEPVVVVGRFSIDEHAQRHGRTSLSALSWESTTILHGVLASALPPRPTGTDGEGRARTRGSPEVS
jgi:hypothetical protein